MAIDIRCLAVGTVKTVILGYPVYNSSILFNLIVTQTRSEY